MTVRQAAELDHAFERNGWTSADVKKLSAGDTLFSVLQVIRGEAEIKEVVRKKSAPPAIPAPLAIDRTTPFNPETFIGRGWKIWRGPKNGDGLIGEEEQDKRSLALTQFDPTKITKANFQTGLKAGEVVITGEVKLARVMLGMIQADAKIAEALYKEDGQKTLRYLFDILGVTWLEFLGTILRAPDGCRYVLYLYRDDSGEWDWVCDWLGGVRGASHPALGFAS